MLTQIFADHWWIVLAAAVLIIVRLRNALGAALIVVIALAWFLDLPGLPGLLP